MNDFQTFSQAIHGHFNVMASRGENLFVTVDGDKVWEAYLAAFPEGTNPIYRERTEHDCSCCRNFIRNLGNVVAIRDGELVSVWSGCEGLPYPYDEVAADLNALVTGQPITGLYRTKEGGYGLESNLELLADGSTHKWHHFWAKVPRKHQHVSPAARIGEYASKVQVFRRGLEELTADSLRQILELINSNNLYRGEEHQVSVCAFEELLHLYQALNTDADRNWFVWFNAENRCAGFRNTVIGTLAVDLSNGVDLETAVKSFETKVAPQNYKRPKALITQRMVQDAMKTIDELGLELALERRHAKLSDVSINDVLWADNSAKSVMKGGIAELLMGATTPANKTKVANAAVIGIEDFMRDVVPTATTMEIFLKGGMQSNLMSLTAPVHDTMGRLFKWNSNFAWSYNGNVTDSIKEKVKKAGGNVSAPFRVSLAWFNGDDLDLHCDTPDRGRIFFGNKRQILDVDENAGWAKNTKDPVENMAWQNPADGHYCFIVDQYSRRSNDNVGFVIQIENNGQVYEFNHKDMLRTEIVVAEIVLRNGQIEDMTISPALEGGGVVQDVWGLKTEQYVKVNTLMLSPNHWHGDAVGNKHYLFVVDNCKNPEPTRGIYNEYLRGDLEQHRRVFEVLGSKTMCPVAEEQLSGLGFSSTRKDTALVRVTKGSRTLTYEVAF